MKNEKPKNPHLRIEHMKSGFERSGTNKIEHNLNPDNIDFSKPQEITLDFLKKIELADPVRENEKRKLINNYERELDEDIKKHLWFALLEYIQE